MGLFRIFIVSLFFALALLSNRVYATDFFTVDQLVNQGLQQNPELKYYEAKVLEAQGERTQAGLWKNPQFSGQYGERRVSDDKGNLEGKDNTRSISVTQTFEFPGKGSLRKAIANKNIELAELGLKQFRLALEGKIQSLAIQYVVAARNGAAAGEISERSSALIKLLQERPAAGTQQLLELRVIEGNLLELQKFTKEVLEAKEEARTELNNLLGWPTSQQFDLQIELTLPPKKITQLNALILSGLSNNLQLKIRTVELEKAIKEVSAQKLEAAPDFSIGPFFSQDKAYELEENLGVTLSMTLPLWNWNQGGISTAKAQKLQADALLLDARRKVENEIIRRYKAYGFVQTQLEQMPPDTIEKFHEASDLADRQYRTGGIGVQLFLEIQKQFLSAQQIRNEAILEGWKNWLDLKLLAGDITTLESYKEQIK